MSSPLAPALGPKSCKPCGLLWVHWASGIRLGVGPWTWTFESRHRQHMRFLPNFTGSPLGSTGLHGSRVACCVSSGISLHAPCATVQSRCAALMSTALWKWPAGQNSRATLHCIIDQGLCIIGSCSRRLNNQQRCIIDWSITCIIELPCCIPGPRSQSSCAPRHR